MRNDVYRRWLALGLCVALAVTAPLGTMAATPGDPDPSFGVNGRADVWFDPSPARATAVAVQADGKLIIAGRTASPLGGDDLAVARLDVDGSLDVSFGNGGRVTTDVQFLDRGNAVAIQPDGKIVVAGSASDSIVTRLVVTRYNTDGAADMSFGSGGVVETDLGAQFDAHANAVAIDAVGRIIVAGARDQQFAVVAFNAYGSLVAQGLVDFPPSPDGSTYSEAFALTLDSGAIVAAGVAPGDTPDFAVVRYDAALNVIRRDTIDLGGFEIARGVVRQSGGRLVLAGESDSALALTRVDAAGLDTTFGSGGMVIAPGLVGASGVAVAADDSLVVAHGATSRGQFRVTRLLADGAIDTSFGVGGTVTTSFGTDAETARAVAIQRDGRIVAAGEAGNDMAVARYLAAGSAENHPPVASADTYTVAEDALLTVAAPGVLANDTDTDGTALTAALVTSPAHGIVTLAADGSFNYTPNSNYHGPDSFSYQANDGTANSSVVTVAIEVTPVNDAPTAAPDAYSTAENSGLSIAAPGVLANDADEDGDALAAILVARPAHAASFTLNRDGSFVYVPMAGYAGADGFTYRASDGVATGGIATVTIAVGRQADIDVTLTAPVSVRRGRDLTYVVTVRNLGPSTVRAGWLYGALFDIRGGLAYVDLRSIVTTRGSCQPFGSSINCSLGPLAPGAVATITVVVRPQLETVLRAVVAATDLLDRNREDPNILNNQATTRTTVTR